MKPARELAVNAHPSGRHFLQIPGPTNVPDRILRAIGTPTVDHRGPQFQQLGRSVLEGLRRIFRTTEPVVIFPASGTGAWEAALVNTLSPGDTVLMCETGHFATLWKRLAQRLGLEVVFLEGTWRRGADAQSIAAHLRHDTAAKIRAVCVVHNETSTGVCTRIPEVRAAIDGAQHPALLMVDTISSLASVDYQHDAWGVDVTVAGSQKGLMLPPGLSFNAISRKALAASAHAKLPRAYWDWADMLEPNARGFFPYTPASNLLYGLHEAIAMLEEEGLREVFARHARLAEATRAAVQGWGLEIVAQDPAEYSATLTAVLIPEASPANADALRAIALEHFNLSLGQGLGRLSGKVFRIGHLGDFNALMLLGALGGVEMALRLAGVPHRSGGVQRAMEVLGVQEAGNPRRCAPADPDRCPELPALAGRNAHIAPFQVMDLVRQASALEAAGRSIIHMSIGEPDFTAPRPVVEALARAAREGRSQYTAATGVAELRKAIAGYYLASEALEVDPDCILITAGASAALTLACMALVNPGDEVLMTDPGYPCNRHFVAAAGGVPRAIHTGEATRFQLSAAMVAQHWRKESRGMLLASPANPTGTSLGREALSATLEAVRERGGFVIMDEIYQGLSYGDRAAGIAPGAYSALHIRRDLVIANSFSKQFHMTGWRLGWLIVPPKWVRSFEKLQQNLYICPSALAQHAALACFLPECLAEFARRRDQFEARRNRIVPALRALGFHIPVTPDGAFYVWASIRNFGMSSSTFAERLLHEAGVSIVPGTDFGSHAAHDWVRFSYATSLEGIEEALARIEAWSAGLNGQVRRGAITL